MAIHLNQIKPKNRLLLLGQQWITKIYTHPLISMLVLAVLTNLYLIADYEVVNRSALKMLWSLAHPDGVSENSILSQGIAAVHWLTGLDYVSSAHLLMIVAYTGIAVLLLLIADLLNFSLLSQWALIFLLLSHPNFNDFRSYIIVEPLFWLLWLLAIYNLLCFHKQQTILSVFLWLGIFLLATRLSVAGWFWLLLFPFGALFWKPWRRKSVSYALLGYAVTVGILLFLPIYHGVSPIHWLQESILANPQPLFETLRLNNNNWVKDGDTLMSAVFVFSGAASLILVRVMVGLGIACLFLLGYAVVKKQYQVIHYDYLRIIVYAIIFDFFIAVVLLILSADQSTVLSFSMTFLLLLFAALGLSYVFKKMSSGRYSRLTVLVIVWCMVAYFASGFIIFGPRQEHLKRAGLSFIKDNPKAIIYSNNEQFLFYADKNPKVSLSVSTAESLADNEQFYYAYAKNRHADLSDFWQSKEPISRYANSHGDELLIYEINEKTSLSRQKAEQKAPEY